MIRKLVHFLHFFVKIKKSEKTGYLKKKLAKENEQKGANGTFGSFSLAQKNIFLLAIFKPKFFCHFYHFLQGKLKICGKFMGGEKNSLFF